MGKAKRSKKQQPEAKPSPGGRAKKRVEQFSIERGLEVAGVKPPRSRAVSSKKRPAPARNEP